MPDKPITKDDLSPIHHRLDELERIVESQSQRYMDIKIEMTRLDEKIMGLREQSKIHSETNKQGMTELKDQFFESLGKVEDLVSGSAKELQSAVDKIIVTLGIDEDEKSASGLRDNLKFLAGLRSSREERIKWTERGIITLILTAVGSLLVAGAIKIAGGH